MCISVLRELQWLNEFLLSLSHSEREMTLAAFAVLTNLVYNYSYLDLSLKHHHNLLPQNALSTVAEQNTSVLQT